MAMPEVIIRKASVFSSLSSSWRITQPVWIRLLATSLLTFLIFLGIAIISLGLFLGMELINRDTTDKFFLDKVFEFIDGVFVPIFIPIWDAISISVVSTLIVVQYYLITNIDALEH